MTGVFAKAGSLIAVSVLVVSTCFVPAVLAAATPSLLAAAQPGTSAANNPAPANNPNGAFNVVVSPTSEDLEVKPGGSVATTLQVKNQGIATEHLKITVMKFTAYGQSGTPELLKPGPGDTFVNWAHFSATQFNAEPNVWTKIQMTISPPKTAAFGYYYAIVFSRAKQSTSSAHPANLVASVAVLVLLDVEAPGAVQQAGITRFSSSHKIYEFLPASFTVQMHNTGNVHVAPRGNIFITKDGKNVGLLEVNLSEGNILPKTYRIFTAQWTNGTPVYRQKTADGKVVLNKQDVPETHLSWSGFSLSKLRFGKYHAQLVMVYSNGQDDISDTTNLSFWVIPWRILGGLLVILLLLLAGVWTILVRPLRSRLRLRKGRPGSAAGPGGTNPPPAAGPPAR